MAASSAGARDLYEFLVDAELQQYYNSLKNDLKVTLTSSCGQPRPSCLTTPRVSALVRIALEVDSC